jgi:hypothetical protein
MLIHILKWLLLYILVMGAVMVIVIAAYWAAEAAINASHQDETANGTDASESIGNNQTPCRHDAGDYSETDI